VPAITRGFERVDHGATSGADLHGDLAGVRPGWRVVVDAEVICDDPVVGSLVACWSAREKLLSQAVYACATAIVLGDSARHEVGTKLRKPLSLFADFPPNAIADPGEIPKLQPRNTEELMDCGMPI
jgi:hypothetical protein